MTVAPVSPPDLAMSDTLVRNATWFAGTPAYIADGRTLTHAQLYARAARLASTLAAAGVRRQDRVSVLGRNSIEFGEVLAAGQLSGIIIATVNFRLAGPEIAAIVADSGPKVLIADAEYLPLIAQHRERFPSVGLVIGIGAPSSGDVTGYEDFLAAAPSGDPPFLARPEDIALLVYTSGTTGRPKGCVLGQRETRRAGQTMNVEMRTGADSRTLLVMPLFHIGAMFIGLGAHFRGGTAVLHRQFDPAAALDTIVAERITALHLAPTMLQALVDAAAIQPGEGRPDALAGVETVVYSAAPITGPTLAAAMRAMPAAGFLNLYGQTEVVSTGLPREFHGTDGSERSKRRLLSVGMPFPGNEVRIEREDGTECEGGEAGEICLRSVAMFRGYWNDSVSTAETLRDGWVHTGDVGLLDEEGLLHLVDRKKDVIISGGENIYSLEVEECLLAHPSVGQVAVIGVPDDTWGEAVSAVVVPADGAAVVPDDLREHVRSRLARFKAPRHVFLTEELPVLSTGKIDKKQLRARYCGREGQDQ
ncbi:MAG TPA: AMP-binding protein [Trebonia sp.]|jgi:acyl-CoA synthetase (AMP-forming)/AMP-acid ligase II